MDPFIIVMKQKLQSPQMPNPQDPTLPGRNIPANKKRNLRQAQG
jgi:hypothetical protein